jgi:FtsP/CotA-like multicopper oxidase with cupredoxin domain
LPYFAAAMSRNQRIGLLAAAVVVAIVAVVIASSGGDDSAGQATTTARSTETTAQTETTTEAEAPAKPQAVRIQIRGGNVVGGPADIRVKKGDQVSIVVSADAPDDIHLHGYDIEKPVEPGKPARFEFTADIEGIFEIESHVAEDAGRDPLVGKLTVEPS